MANRLRLRLEPQNATLLRTIFNALLETEANEGRMLVQEDMLQILYYDDESNIRVSLAIPSRWLLHYFPNIFGNEDEPPQNGIFEPPENGFLEPHENGILEPHENGRLEDETDDDEEDEDEPNALDLELDLGSLLEFFRDFEDDYWFKLEIPNLSSQPYRLKVMSSVTENDGNGVEEMLINISNFNLVHHTPLKQLQEYRTSLLVSMNTFDYVPFRNELVQAIEGGDYSFRIMIRRSLGVIRVRHTYFGGGRSERDLWANVERFPGGSGMMSLTLINLHEAGFIVPILESAVSATLMIPPNEGFGRPPVLSLKFHMDPISPELTFVLEWYSILRPLVRIN